MALLGDRSALRRSLESIFKAGNVANIDDLVKEIVESLVMEHPLRYASSR
jgi:hypothetical protein